MVVRFSWFMMGLAVGFLLCATMSFVFSGRFGFLYLASGGLATFAAFAVALRESHEPDASPDR